MNQITDKPNNNYDFGLDFDYAVWSANSDITLTNVPWNSDYRDVVSFESTDELNRYINRSLSANINMQGTYAKATEPVLISTPFNVANQFNYVRVYNPAQPVTGDRPKYFYYFITDVRYIAPNTTAIVVQLDVMQTYMRSVRFGNCYIERGHIGIANENAFRNYGRDYLTVPEGLDMGSDYMPVRTISAETRLATPAAFSVVVVSTIKLEGKSGSVDAPLQESAEGGRTQGLATGAASYLFATATDFINFMRNYSSKPWITQGIISIRIIPPISRYFTVGQLGAKLSIGAYKMPEGAAYKGKVILKDWRNVADIVNYIPARYRRLRKFFTFPYMAIELTNMLGQSSILKPERLNSDDFITVEEVSLVAGSMRIGWYADGYNSRYTPISTADGAPVSGYEYGVSISDFPSVPIVNNQAILALANSAHSREFGYQSAAWSQQRALRGNQVSYDQASAGISAASEQAAISASADRTQLGIQQNLQNSTFGLNALGSAVGATAGGLSMGLPGAAAGLASSASGTLMSGMTLGQQQAAAQESLAARLSSAGQSQAVSAGLAGNIRDTNKSLADWAAKGDYENAIASMNAKIQDAALTPPSLIGQSGGETLGILNFRFGYEARVIMPDQAVINSIGEYWLRYGYAVNRFSRIPDNLMVMDRFTYWKLKETYIHSAPMPETFKQAIRGILEKGVTVWRNPDDIGFIDIADNRPLSGITLDGYVPPNPDPEPDPEPPTPIKKRNHKMIVFSSIDENPATPGNVWALAGTAPGTDANWLETRDPARADQFLDACQVEAPVGLPWADFQDYRDKYLSPVTVMDAEIQA